MSIRADKLRLCRAKRAHELVPGNTDASLAQKPLTVSDAPHLDTETLIQKLHDVAKAVDFAVSTIFAEHIKTQYLVLYDPGIARKILKISIHQKSNSLKVSYDITKSLTDFL